MNMYKTVFKNKKASILGNDLSKGVPPQHRKLKRMFLHFYDSYCLVMDHKKNPLREIPDPLSRMWVMTVLAWMWSVIFGLCLGSIIYSGISMVVHFLLLWAITFTAAVFYEAERRQDSWLLELRD